jgi:hypothetical protein
MFMIELVDIIQTLFRVLRITDSLSLLTAKLVVVVVLLKLSLLNHPSDCRWQEIVAPFQ